MLRKFGLAMSTVILKLSLVLLALFGAGQMVLGTPEALKTTAEETGLYQEVVDGVYENIKNQPNDSGQNLPLNDPEVERIIKNAFSDEVIRENTESIIDGVYSWLRGETHEPTFVVDLSSARDDLAQELSALAATRYAEKEPCTLSQVQNLNTQEINVFELPCRIPGISAEQAGEKVEEEVKNNTEYLSANTYSLNDLSSNQDGEVATGLKNAPVVFQALSMLPWLLAALVAVCAGGILVLSDRKQRGLRTISWTSLAAGVFLLLGALITRWITSNTRLIESDQVQQSFIEIVRNIINIYLEHVMLFAAVYLVVGALGFGLLWIHSKHKT
jgi:hypothetical protein